MVMILCMNMFVQLHGELILVVFLLSRYLSELLAERHKIIPFMPVLPNIYRLLNQGEVHCTSPFHTLRSNHVWYSEVDIFPLDSFYDYNMER